jgi:hypothetical protein
LKHAGFDLPLELFEPEIEFPLSMFTLKECVSNRLQLFSAANVYFLCLTAFSASNTRFFTSCIFPASWLIFHLKFSRFQENVCVFQNLKDSANEPQSKIMSVKMKFGFLKFKFVSFSMLE